MSLVDDVVITVKAGDGGNGGTATKKLYASKKTVPDGGNGGNGGNIYFKGSSNVSDLSEFRFKKKIVAKNGVSGLNKDLDGAKGEDTTVLVPFGTTITDVDSSEYVEILTDKPFCVAYGGRGGIGNHDYKINIGKLKSPKREGEKGEERRLHLVLNLIADVGLVGLPNAGKSSLLKALTNAAPKIGNYPFTTIEPNLGAMGKIILADIPGLIEGASEGKGLGTQFLKHIKKTKVLLHCIDSSEENILHAYQLVRDEFKSFDPQLLEKKEIILLTKKDLIDKKRLSWQEKLLKQTKREIFFVSIYDEKSLSTLKSCVASFFEDGLAS